MKLILSVRDINGIDHFINPNYVIRIEVSGFAKFSDMYQYTVYMTDKHKINVYGDELKKFLNQTN